MGVIDLQLQGHFGLKLLNMPPKWVVRTISPRRFDLHSPNLTQRCILGRFRLGLYMGVIDLELQGHLGLKLFNTSVSGR